MVSIVEPAVEQPVEEHLTAEELAHAAGVSYRQVDYWTRVGYLVTVDGKRSRHAAGRYAGTWTRYYDPHEVEVAQALGQLLSRPARIATLVRAAVEGWPIPVTVHGYQLRKVTP